jgi:hypothetical protein
MGYAMFGHWVDIGWPWFVRMLGVGLAGAVSVLDMFLP